MSLKTHAGRDGVANDDAVEDNKNLADHARIDYDSHGYPHIPDPDRMTHKGMQRSLREILTFYYREYRP